MLDKGEQALWDIADRCVDREQRNVYITAKDKLTTERKAMADQFQKNYVAEFERRAKRESKRDEFSQYDLSSLELGLVNDEELEETLKLNDMAGKLRRYCEEELNGLDQRIGVLIGDANLQGDGNPFSPQALCGAWKATCRGIEPSMKIRMIFHKLFDDHILDDVRSIYKDLNALLIQRSILPKIRYGTRRGAGAIGRRPGAPAGMADSAATVGAAPGMPAGINPLAMNMQAAMPPADAGDGGYGGEGAEGDLFGMLQSLLARGAHTAMSHAIPGAHGAGLHGAPATGFPIGALGPGVAGAPAGTMVQVAGFPPIMTGAIDGNGRAIPSAGANVVLPQRFLHGAELIGSLTRLQHGDAAALPAGMSALDLSALTSGRTNVVRELKSRGFGEHVDHNDGVTIDIVAMLFDQIFGDPRVPETLKALIGRLQIPVVKVAVLDKKFFSKKSHPARRMLDTLGEFALGLDESFDQSWPLYKKIEAIIARLLEDFVDNVDIFETLHAQLLEVIREENKRAELSAKEMARKIAYKERLEVGKAMAQLEIKSRAQANKMPQLIQKFLADEWVKLLLLTYARHGQDSEAWKSALETVDHLIWSVTSKSSVEERRKLAHLLPGLLKRVHAALQLIGTPEEKRKQFFTRLMRMHTKAMSGAVPRPRESSRAATPSVAGAPSNIPPRPTVPILNDAVVPASAAVTSNTQPVPDSVSDVPPLPEVVPLPSLDFGLEPIARQSPRPDARQPRAQQVLSAPSIPAIPPASVSTPSAESAVDVDEEVQTAEALQFSSVTIKNPFGEGEIEVEEISLSDLPGFRSVASNNDDAAADDQYGRVVKNLKAGDWLEFRAHEPYLQARLSYISPLKGTYLFVNRRGESVGEYSLPHLAQELRCARALVLEDVPLIDRAMSSLVGALKKNIG
jgi:hypothetical protein